MQIKATPAFLKQANKFLKKNPQLRKDFTKTIKNLTSNPFDQSLKTHKLSGELKDFWSCHVTYDIRIRFILKANIIELIGIGSHDEIYD
ncbi:MAG: type II toxin-antitoxin system mRNA interferase toxin, RelE/StbE family [Nitrospirae bacterium]|uniref:type II toxin-antitoxin system RelE/ParE family toxin n=1 Tax=Candidatus Magnetobacterium casense TaxID=1455061 RepID=UPI00058AF459|nr:type II toxin-antitoxin system mRNA interferase toxin, RelE/StbE family [Nitrospirota bacterium]